VDVSPTLISHITDATLDEVRAWQSRPLASVSPILYFDAQKTLRLPRCLRRGDCVCLTGDSMPAVKHSLREDHGGMVLRRTPPAVYDTLYHVVWSPQYRRDVV
jgi:hypothetical protein